MAVILPNDHSYEFVVGITTEEENLDQKYVTYAILPGGKIIRRDAPHIDFVSQVDYEEQIKHGLLSALYALMQAVVEEVGSEQSK